MSSTNQYFPKTSVFLVSRNREWIKDHSKCIMNSSLIMVSDSTSQLVFKRPPLVKCWNSVKEYPPLPKKAVINSALEEVSGVPRWRGGGEWKVAPITNVQHERPNGLPVSGRGAGHTVRTCDKVAQT